ncbi:NUDIX domain-containing protein [Paenibacillus thiaminolyticus]|uniref:NUDIX domain-containing protein n=1 Tax=Paenibacillus thiaminolyticus TaxID=49283 RepID=UPI000E044260|nr:NUDIX hydrolase [Paenibacillus thiaminolyticus]SUA98947.1 NUDIX hydrolase [Paenibacillus thiaminolyticus]
MMTMPTHIEAVGGIVENEQGHILVVKAKHDGWVFPGGQVEAGENLIGVYSNTGTYKWHDG